MNGCMDDNQMQFYEYEKSDDSTGKHSGEETRTVSLDSRL